jgi:hypothetical protein
MLAFEILAPVAYVAVVFRAYITRFLKERLGERGDGKTGRLALSPERA